MKFLRPASSGVKELYPKVTTCSASVDAATVDAVESATTASAEPSSGTARGNVHIANA